jgi:hypothetical protein
MSNKQIHYVRDLAGGLNTTFDDELIEDNQCALAQECTFDRKGGVRKRKGKTVRSSGIFGSKISSLYRYYYGTTGKKLLKTAGVSMAYEDDTSGNMSGIATTYTDNRVFDYTTHTDTDDTQYVLIANGADKVTSYEGTAGTSVVELSGAPKAQYIDSYMDRVWCAGVSQLPNRLYNSSLGSMKDWTTPNDAGFIDVPNCDQGDYITGVKNLMENLVIMQNNNIFVLTGTTPYDFVLRKTNSNVGSECPWTIKNIKSYLAFLDKTSNNVYLFNGVDSYPIGDPIREDLKNINSANYSNSVAGVYQNRWDWLAVPYSTATTNNRVYTYDTMMKAWAGPYTTISANCFASFDGPGDAGELLCGDYSGYVQKLDTGTTDNGTDITMDYRTKNHDVGMPEYHKRFKKVTANVSAIDSAYLSIAYSIDGGTFTEVPYLISPLNSGESYRSIEAPITGRGKTVQLKFKTIADTVIHNYGIVYKPKRLR